MMIAPLGVEQEGFHSFKLIPSNSTAMCDVQRQIVEAAADGVALHSTPPRVVANTAKLSEDEKNTLWDQMNRDGMLDKFTREQGKVDREVIFGGLGNIEWMYEVTGVQPPRLLFGLQRKHPHIPLHY